MKHYAFVRRLVCLIGLGVVGLACSDDTQETDGGVQRDAATSDVPTSQDAGPVECDAAEAAGYTLCGATTNTCSIVFEDGAGCVAACANIGLECTMSFDTADTSENVCDEDDRLGELGCADTGHDSDYCVCGRAAMPDAGGPDAGPEGDAGPGLDAGVPPGVLAFPSARGAGAFITGGRGGEVVAVTRLDDARDGEGDPVLGTLRYALTRTFPRTIVFRVSGTIVIGDTNGDGELDADERAAGGTYPSMIGIEAERFSNFTVAGQTAPEGGITIQGIIYTSRVNNMIWRYVRVRQDPYFNGFDTFSANTGTDVVLDHLSISYGTDEGASLRGDADVEMTGVTLQYNLVADSKTGSIVGNITGSGIEATVVNNFFTNTSHRFPNVAGEGRFDVINNLTYNWENRLVNVHNASRLNHINNAYVSGPRTREDTASVANKLNMGTEGILGARIYTAGNFITGLLSDAAADNWVSWQVFVNEPPYVQGDPGPSELQTDTMHSLLGFAQPIRSTEDLMAQLPDEVGAIRTLRADGSLVSYRDSLDQTCIEQYRSGTGPSESYSCDENRVCDFTYANIPSNEPYADTDGDGMPDAWESANGFDPDVDDGAGDADDDGYTNLEEFLNLVDG
ncbi:MAG: hypothetical protein AB8H86_10295 [Polyangiales bacterium]